jgi:HD-GYP domain-containing protein (c-di-GMP phosphodiesterase class II)
MRLTATSSIEPGMVLATDVLTGLHQELPLVRAGVMLDGHHRDALLGAGIYAVYVEDELGAGIEVTPALSERTRGIAMKAVVRTFAELSQRCVGGGALTSAAVGELSGAVQLICQDLVDADHAVLALRDLAAADSYTLQHSIDVTALGLLIARRHFHDFGRPAPYGARSFEKIEQQLIKLGVGLLLHDIGKVAMPTSILHKKGRLDDEELALMRTHPMRGIELVAEDLIGPLSKGVIRGHHEQFAGGGYPDGRAGHEIPEFARIATVADVFDAVTSTRVYSPAAPAHVGVRTILEGSGRFFDPAIVETFRKVVAPYPPGSEIELADGRRGVVVSVPLTQVDRPLVRVLWDQNGERTDREEIDLRERPLLAPLPLAA